MPLRVHILASCRKPELWPATTLVFQTIRTGFPTAEICVAYNNLTIHQGAVLDGILDKIGGKRVPTVGYPIDHHHWIASLIENESEPFFLADTDLVFWSSMEQFDFSGAALAGRYTPQFKCNFANAVTRSRLHTCCLYVAPVRVKEAVQKYGERFPDCYATPRPTLQDLVYPRYIPHKCGALLTNYFHDTMALLFHAIGGELFTVQQNMAFEHLQSGTLSDVVGDNYIGGNIAEFHAAVMDNPSLLKGQWQRDLAHYASRYAE